MDATRMLKKNLPDIYTFKKDFPAIKFKEHSEFYWSAFDKTIYYHPKILNTEEGLYRILHEIGHALSDHTNFTSGIQLLKFEAEAWQQAKELAVKYAVIIEDDFIETCLDSYRDWLHLRSTCPDCKNIAVESDSNQYHCFNCFSQWKVPQDQRTRHYRLKLAHPTPS